MITRQVLARIPGLTRQELYSMERGGYISVAKTRRREREVRNYSDREVEKIRIIQRLKSQGFPLRRAARNAEERLKRLTSRSIVLPLWALYHEQSTVGEVVERVHKAHQELKKMGVLPGPFAKEKNPWKKQLEQLIDKSHPEFNQEILYFAAKRMLDQFYSYFRSADVLLTVSSTGSLLAGAISALAYQTKQESLCPIIPWDVNSNFRCRINPEHAQQLILIEGFLRNVQPLIKIVRQVHGNGYKVIQVLVFCSLCDQKERRQIEKEGSAFKTLFVKEDFLTN